MHMPDKELSKNDTKVLPIVAERVCVNGAENQPLLKDIDLVLSGTGVTVLIGPNGAGKSLLLRVLAGLVPPSSGSVSWAGKTGLGENVRKLGFVFQKPVLFRRTALENITFSLRQSGYSRQDALAKANSVLSNANLEHLADAPARRLSGGEQQRLAIARAQALEPEVLFLDEPTAHLDPAATAKIERMVDAVRAYGIRVVFVTHDLGQARRLANDIIFIHHGALLEQAPAAAFFAGPKSEAARTFVAGGLVL